MPEDDSGKAGKGGFLAFWTTLPGILTGVAAVVTAFVGLATFLQHDKPSTEPAAVTASSLATQPAANGGGVLSRGRLSLRSGDEVDLETGVIGISSSSDLSFGPESTPWLHAGGGGAFFAPVPTAPTRKGCVTALTHRRDPFEELPNLGTRWICVSTDEGDVAAVEVVALPGVGNPDLRLAYTVWR